MLVENENPEKGGKAFDVRSGTGLTLSTATFKPFSEAFKSKSS